jgi:hypothetical protein
MGTNGGHVKNSHIFSEMLYQQDQKQISKRLHKAMEEESHIINPEGEVIIIGHNPNAPFAVWNDESAQVVEPADSEKLDEVANRLPAVLDFDSDSEASNDEPANVSVNEVNSVTSKADVRIQVSAKHLMLASPVSKKTLTGKWKAGSTFVGTGSVEIPLRAGMLRLS